MKIERIDDKTVKCFLSNEELEQYDITYKDFLTRSEKAKEVVEEIIAQAVTEVDYKPPQFAFDLQIMMLPDQGMVLTFSEKTPEDVKNGLSLLHYLKEMQKILGEKLSREQIAGILSQAAAAAAAGIPQPDQTGEAGIPQSVIADEDTAVPVHTEQKQSRPEFAIFRFTSMRDICEYARALPKNLRVVSRLYREGDAYYLYLGRGNASYERYSRAAIQALEFSELYAATEDKAVYLEEHGECLIAEKAITRLKL